MPAAMALALVHLVVLLAHFAPAIMSPDANGYVVQARLIAEQGRTSFTPESPLQYVGMHWLETADGVFHSRYPAGLPTIMAAAWETGGLTAALLVNPLLASATVLLVFFLGRSLAGPWFGLVAAAVIAAVPIANQHALDADAHTAAAFFLLAGVMALRRFGATRSAWCGLLAGLLLGALPAIRYPEAVAGLAIGAWLLWRVRPIARIWPAIAGAALPIGVLLAHNAAAYGAWWRTGYALTNEQTGFGLGYFANHAVPYVQNLGGAGLSLFFAFGVAGMAALAADRRWRSDGVLLAGIVVSLVVLYMAYYFGGPGGGAGAGNLRFLIPTFPFFAVAGAWLLSRLPELGFAGRAAVITVVALQLLVSGMASLQALARTKLSLRAAASAHSAAGTHIPPGSVVIADRMLAESLDAVGAWRLAEENLVAGFGPRMGGGPGIRAGFGGAPAGDDDDRPMPMQPGKNRAQRERYATRTPAERRELVWADLAAWAGDRPVYWFTRSVDRVADGLPPGADYDSVAEIDAPMMAGFGGPGSGGMSPPGAMLRGRAGPGGTSGGGFGPMPPRVGVRGGPGMVSQGGFAFGGRELGEGAPKLRLMRITLPKP